VRRLIELSAVAALALALAAPGGAVAAGAAASGSYRAVLRAYERAGTIPPCQFTGSQLQGALSGVDTYGAQYFADFTQAIQSALTSRAAGACAGGAAPTRAAPVPAPVPGPRSDHVARLPGLTGATSAGVPAPLIALGALAVAAALLGAGAAAASAVSR
jgi:hypothetical protein